MWCSGINVYLKLYHEVVGSNPMFAVIFYVNLKIYQLLAQTDVDSMWTNMDLCGMVWIRVEWCGSTWNGVESMLVHAESMLVRMEHQGEGKLLTLAIGGITCWCDSCPCHHHIRQDPALNIQQGQTGLACIPYHWEHRKGHMSEAIQSCHYSSRLHPSFEA